MLAAKPKTADVAAGRWSGILQRLGIDPAHLQNKHGPCPMCGGVDRFRYDNKNERGTWFCSHCGAGDGFALLRGVFGWTFSEAAHQVDRIAGTVAAGPIKPARTDEDKLRALNRVWSGTRTVVQGDPVWLYLNRRLGIEQVPPGLRLHPALTYTDENGRDLGRFPAMVAKLVYPDGKPASIHRTYLTDGGEKAPVPGSAKKIMAGRALKTAAVRLSAVGRSLGIAEGVETALAASIRFGVPVWAATNAGLLESWVPPAGVEQVLIAGDNDASYTGQAAAFALAHRLARDGYQVRVEIPERAGTDWADR